MLQAMGLWQLLISRYKANSALCVFVTVIGSWQKGITNRNIGACSGWVGVQLCKALTFLTVLPCR